MPDSEITSRPRFLPFEMSEVWFRFLMAIIGLVLAFGAALFSTVAREVWKSLGNVHLFVGRAGSGDSCRPDHGPLSGAPGCRWPRSRCLRLRRDPRRHRLRPHRRVDRNRRSEHRQQPALRHCGSDAGGDSGVGHGVGGRSARTGTGCSSARPAFLPAVGAPAKIVVRNRRRWLPSFSISVIPLKHEQSFQTLAMGTRDFWLPARTSSRQAVGHLARPTVAPRR